MSEGDVQPTREEIERQTAEAVVAAGHALEGEDIPPIAGTEKFRAFVAAKAYANYQVLVKEGTPVKLPPSAMVTAGVEGTLRRDGDIYARFRNGVLVTDVPEIIEWCLKHPDICQDADDPRAAAWASLKAGQTKTATSEATTDPGLDVTSLIFPDATPKTPEAPK
jgi:hypothetical protein